MKRGFTSFAESSADDLPDWRDGPNGRALIVPHTIGPDGMRSAVAQGYDSGGPCMAPRRDAFAGGAGTPKMLSIGLDCRLTGLMRFLDHVAVQDGVWRKGRIDVARHWIARHPPG